MTAVVMEADMKAPKRWKGILGAALGARLYPDFSNIDAWNDEELDSAVESLLLPQMPWLRGSA
eukprot:CAMPEP_0117665866 /NCGR_PEP_ID=MMETSP0804-20121206/10049_1 /TAXON_ID=1074897 /ORGANISM="Tetraselmis astigmatica, Strain CCMP880" /LENGTH=62 /DNA_ID=CAMNT_0005473329 /DNA_START=288 /DNA_END=476 /DNA_ORIENTATION=-